LTNTATSITRNNFSSLYPIPLYFCLFATTAYLLAQLGTRTVVQVTPSQRNFCIANLMFSNTNSLPIALLQSLAVSSAFVWLRHVPGDDAQSVAARGIGYIVFYSFFGNMVRWSYGHLLLKNDLDSPGEAEEIKVEPWVLRRISVAGYVWNGMYMAYKFLSKVTSPPLIGALIGLIVALNPVLNTAVVKPGTFLHATLFVGLRKCGDASVPLLLVCLGAQLSSLLGTEVKKRDVEINNPAYPSYQGVLGFIVLSRLVILPLLTFLQVLYTHKWFPIAQDPMFIVTIMLIGSCPTAINLMTVCQTEGRFELPMGRSLLFQYGGGLLTLSLWCVLFLWHVHSK
jgi:predicted permease